MTVIGIELGARWCRAAALVDGAVIDVAPVAAAVGFVDGGARVGVRAETCPPADRVDAVVEWLARPDDGGVAGVAWPVLDGQARSPVELVAQVLRAVVVAVEAEHGRVDGAVLAVPLTMSALERRVMRDAALAAGVGEVRLVAAAAAAAVAIDDDRPARLLIIHADAGRLAATVVEHVDGVVDVLGHAAGALDPSSLELVCERALRAAAVPPAALSDVAVIGGDATDPALHASVVALYAHATMQVDSPAAVVARGAARLARMFLDEPAAVCVDVLVPGLSLGAGSALAPMIGEGTLVPTREVRLIARDRATRAAIEVELWEDSSPPRPYGRYHIAGLPPGSGAIAACEVTVDVDRIPRIDASDLVNGGSLAVTPVVEVGLSTEAVAELRAALTRQS